MTRIAGATAQGRLTRIIHSTIADPAIEQAVRPIVRAVEELQRMGGVVHENVTLADDSETLIAHGLGHAPLIVVVSPPRNAITSGRITELRPTTVDRTRVVQLGSYGWGADIIVDIWFLDA